MRAESLLQQTGPNSWEFRCRGRLVYFYIKDKQFSYEEGPEDPTARQHEGGGGIFTCNEFFEKNLLKDYPEVYQQIESLVRPHCADI